MKWDKRCKNESFFGSSFGCRVTGREHLRLRYFMHPECSGLCTEGALQLSNISSTTFVLLCMHINELISFFGQEQREERRSTAPRSYSSVLINFGKCLLLIVIVPPFLNYASLQREGQMLLPKGILSLRNLLILCQISPSFRHLKSLAKLYKVWLVCSAFYFQMARWLMLV